MSIRELVQKYRGDEKFRNKVNLYASAACNLAFVAVQLYGGIRYQSPWFTALAVYYALLSAVRFYIGRAVGKQGSEAWAVFRWVGFVMLILNLVLILMISIMITNPEIAIHRYSVVIAVIVAFWTIGSAGMTVYNLVQVRKKNDPVALADRLVGLVTAVVSVLMLQTAMIASLSTPEIEQATGLIEEFGSLANVPEEISGLFTEIFQRLALSNDITGVLVGISAMGVAGYMIVRGIIERRKLKSEKPRS